MMKVMTILGTRPEIIRLSRVMAALDSLESVEHVVVHTGQNYDFQLNGVFFEELEIRKPDHFLEVGEPTLGGTLGNILCRSEAVMLKESPDAVLILGDTNSSLAAIIAKRLHIPVYHMEAGNRSFDDNVPEELNRRIVDHIADFNLVYTEHARRHLISEGLPHRRIYLTGSPMTEVLSHYRSGIDRSSILGELGLSVRGYFVVSIHREENVDNRSSLLELLSSLNALVDQFRLPIVVSTHPRTRKRLEALECECDDRIQFLKPFGFFDYNQLQLKSRCAISDSGTISEEAAILGFPAITVRNAIERPESLDTGSILMTGLKAEVILPAVSLVVDEFSQGKIPPVPEEYQVTNTSQRVVRLILGTAGLSNRWAGIEGKVQ
jgi:UDP-N-acetyl-L-fucosamine synthase